MTASYRRLIAFALCLVLVAGCSDSGEDALARAKAEAEQAKAELERLKAAQPDAEPKREAVAAIEPQAASTPSEPWAREWKVLVNTENPPNMKTDESGTGWFAGELTTKYGIRPLYEGAGKRSGFMILHPISLSEPAKLGFKGSVPRDRPVLVVEAAGTNAGDAVLRCVANGKAVGEYVLNGKKWTTAEFDLSEFASASALELELWNVAGGQSDWYFETCYIDNIDFADAPTQPAVARAETSPPPGPLVFEHSLLKPGIRRVMTFVKGQYGSHPKFEAGSGLKLTGGHTAPAVWAQQYLGEKYRVEFEMKLDNEHAWAVVMLNAPGYGNSHDAGYGCRINPRHVTLLRDGVEEESIEKPQTGEWARVQADVDGGSVELMLDGVAVAAMEDPEPLTGPANGWFGVVGREVTLRNLKIWSPEGDLKRQRQMTPPPTEQPAANGELLYELALSGEQLGSEWNQTQPQAVKIQDGALLLSAPNGTPQTVLSQPLSGDLACEVEFEYPENEAVNFSVALLFAEKAPATVEEINVCEGWRVELPNGHGNSAIAWHASTDQGEGVWRGGTPLDATGYYAAAAPERKYVARMEMQGDALRVFLDGGLLLEAKRPETAAPSGSAFLSLRQIYGGSKVHAVRVSRLGG